MVKFAGQAETKKFLFPTGYTPDLTHAANTVVALNAIMRE